MNMMVAAVKWLAGWVMYFAYSVSLYMVMTLSDLPIWVKFPASLGFIVYASYNIRRPGYQLIKNNNL